MQEDRSRALAPARSLSPCCFALRTPILPQERTQAMVAGRRKREGEEGEEGGSRGQTGGEGEDKT
eukprot:766442-Hanusia_phi.AAC.5